MTVTVKLFAVLRERAETGELMLDLPEGAIVAAALDAVASQLPSIADYLRRCAFAVNRTYCKTDEALSDGDELALIPPVSGG